MKNKDVIRARLKANGAMSGLDLVKAGKEKASGLLETVRTMVESGEIEKTDGGLYRLPVPRDFRLEPEDLPSDAEFAEIVQGYPNVMIAIGFVGIFQCYLNVPLSEAVARYEARNDEEIDNSTSIEIVVFHDEIQAYSISAA